VVLSILPMQLLARIIYFAACLNLAVVVVGCSDPPNTQRLPIGSRCSSNDACGTEPYTCEMTAPNGYCDKACTLNNDCPPDSVCPPALLHCRRPCKASSECRQVEGYTCVSNANNGATAPFCDVQVDGGT
jgi:hypothetical protein